jgi:hypothetical protein
MLLSISQIQPPFTRPAPKATPTIRFCGGQFDESSNRSNAVRAQWPFSTSRRNHDERLQSAHKILQLANARRQFSLVGSYPKSLRISELQLFCSLGMETAIKALINRRRIHHGCWIDFYEEQSD